MDDQRSDGSRWLTILLIVGAGVVSAFQVGKAPTALGCNPEVLSELLPAAEAGLVEALCADPVPDHRTYSDDSGLS